MFKKLGSVFLVLVLISACTTSSIRKLSETSGSLTFASAATVDAGLVSAINRLAFLLQEKQPASNDFISSLSIYLALAMTSHASAGTSYAQFMALLNPQHLSETAWLGELRTLQGDLNALAKVKFALSNSLWIRASFADSVKADFLQRNKDYFGAMVAALDFSKTSALDDINNWVKKNTNNLIPKTLEEINPATIMFLINTIYFKGSWASPFDAKQSIDLTFRGSSVKTVKFMTQTASYAYAETADEQSVLLPYSGNGVGMLIVMGKTGTAPINSVAAFNAHMASLRNTSVKLTMPLVDIATTQVLNDKLSALGLSDPFIAGKADFSRLADADLFISQVLHKTRLKINEAGTEAAAVTVVAIDKTSIQVPEATMTIDHPFQIFIVDLKNNLILFSGMIQDVQAAQ